MTQTSTTATTTNTEIIPQRVTAEHYKTKSFTNPNKAYDQKFDYDLKRWNCNCPDFDYRKNLNCKHVILLRAYIKKEKASQQAPERQHSSSVELVQVLTRISNLEHNQDSVDIALERMDHALCIKEDRLGILQGRLTGREYQIDKQQKDLVLQRELIGNLQTSVCRLNERTINQDVQIQQQTEQIQQLLAAMEQQRRMIEDQAQQIDKLHEAVSQQARPVEQVVKIVIDQPAQAPNQPQQARQERQPSEDTVKQISKTECKVGKFKVQVRGNCAAGCDCSIGIMDRQCPHMVKVDQFLSK